MFQFHLYLKGNHRELGPTITRVKSLTLDSWTSDLIEIMIQGGNKSCNNYWENKIPNYYQKPNSESSKEAVKFFIKDKYIKKMFIPPNLMDPVSKYKGIKQRKMAPEINLQDFADENEMIPARLASPKQNLEPANFNNMKKQEKPNLQQNNQNNIKDGEEAYKFNFDTNRLKSPALSNWEVLPSEFDTHQPKKINRNSKILNNDWLKLNNLNQTKNTNNNFDINEFNTVSFDIRKGVNSQNKNPLEFLKENNINDKKPPMMNNDKKQQIIKDIKETQNSVANIKNATNLNVHQNKTVKNASSSNIDLLDIDFTSENQDAAKHNQGQNNNAQRNERNFSSNAKIQNLTVNNNQHNNVIQLNQHFQINQGQNNVPQNANLQNNNQFIPNQDNINIAQFKINNDGLNSNYLMSLYAGNNGINNNLSSGNNLSKDSNLNINNNVNKINNNNMTTLNANPNNIPMNNMKNLNNACSMKNISNMNNTNIMSNMSNMNNLNNMNNMNNINNMSNVNNLLTNPGNMSNVNVNNMNGAYPNNFNQNQNFNNGNNNMQQGFNINVNINIEVPANMNNHQNVSKMNADNIMNMYNTFNRNTDLKGNNMQIQNSFGKMN